MHKFLAQIGLLHTRTRLPVVLFFTVMTILVIQRFALLVVMGNRFAAAGWGELAWAFVVGMRFDAVVAGMMVVPLMAVLPFAPPRLLTWRPMHLSLLGYVVAAVTLLVMLGIVDFYFFKEFGERINHKAVNYLAEQGNGYLYHLVWDEYPVLPALLVSMLAGVVVAMLIGRVGVNHRYNVGPMWQAVVWPALGAAVVALVIRGTVGSHAINTGPAYFSSSSTVAQLTLNGGFTLRQAIFAALAKDIDLSDLYDTIPQHQARERAAQLIVQPGDKLLNDPVNPLLRVTDSGKPQRDYNVVFIVLESMSWHYVGSLGGDERLTPNLDRIASQGLLLEQCFAVGGRTQRGFAGLMSGFPDLPIASVTTRNEVAGRFLTLPSLLKGRGYQTLFIYGGPALRDHRQTYLGSNGVDQFVDQNDLPIRTFRTKLGWCDGDLFESALQVLSNLPEGKPFFASMLTLSFHAPYDIPPGKIEPVEQEHEYAAQLDAIRYTDWALGRFMEQARQTDWFDNTIFVLAADHMGGYREHPLDISSHRVPVVLYGPGIAELSQPRRLEAICSQMDVAPTVMGLLGGSYTHTFFGSDVLSRPADRGFALAVADNGELLYLQPNSYVTVVRPHEALPRVRHLKLPNHLKTILGEERTKRANATVPDALALLQVADELFREGRFNISAAPESP